MNKLLTSIVRVVVLVVVSLSCAPLIAQSLTQKLYIDFGPNGISGSGTNGSNGKTTLSPDINGNHWNNMYQPTLNSTLNNLINASGTPSSMSLIMSKGMSMNGMVSNGGLASPSSELIGDLAIENATIDYFFTNNASTPGAIKLTGLDELKGYRFFIFGSRSNSETRVAKYQFTGKNQETAMQQTSGSNIGGSSINGNNAVVFGSDFIYPDDNGEILMDISVAAGSYACVNAIRIDEYTFPEKSTLKQKIYIDLGPDGTGSGNRVNGVLTQSPDINGNYWNNLDNMAINSTLSLVNSANTASGFSTEILTPSMNYNGKSNGGLYAPNQLLLGDLAIESATVDYAFPENSSRTGTIKFKGLNSSKGYRFHIFGSRTSTEFRIARYSLTGANYEIGQYQTSGSNFGGTSINANTTNTFHSGIIVPNVAGEILLDISCYIGSYCHFNAIRLEEIEIPIVEAESVTIKGENITASGVASQMTATILPENTTIQSVVWSIDDQAIASISPLGLLCPKKNGTVTVTATWSNGKKTISDSKTIQISNQIREIFLSGAATEIGDKPEMAIKMRMVGDLDGNISPVFELYTSLTSGQTYNFYTDQTAESRILSTDATSGVDGPVRITFDLTSNTVSILPISKWSVVGSIISGGWGGDQPLTYQRNGVWKGQLAMNFPSATETPRFIFRANGSWDYSLKRIKGTDDQLRLSSEAATFGYTVDDIGQNPGVYNVTLDPNSCTYQTVCVDIPIQKAITVIGSSGANGQGATNMQGYIYQYSLLLNDRFSQNFSNNDFKLSNAAINGTNTVSTLSRWQKDLTVCDRYLWYGLVLGNEGIKDNANKDSIFNQYRDNMQILFQKARHVGAYPLASNCYSRDDYSSIEYDYIKRMNLLIHQWDVPSINLLGALDDGNGRWVNGYQADFLHPNTAGHSEFMYAVPPSLFDAIEAGKPLPVRATNNSCRFNSTDAELQFTPEQTTHSFTQSIDVQTTNSGNLFSFTETSGIGKVDINTDGAVSYRSPKGGEIASPINIGNNEWHTITLSHYYAQGATYLYIDGVTIGKLDERLNVGTFSLNTNSNGCIGNYRNWLFYRSGMNELEAKGIFEGLMLKSSLELYAPLYGKEEQNDPFINIAQSMNKLTVNQPTSIQNKGKENFSLYPTWAEKELHLKGVETGTNFSIAEVSGRIAMQGIYSGNSLNISALSSGYYFFRINEGSIGFIKTK